MRIKTDDRRRAILDAATAIFRDVGYERASMATISARVGGSKATLYSYFKSKEELFVAAMLDAMEDQAQQVIRLLDPEDLHISRVITNFGEAYVCLVTSGDALALTRNAVAEGANAKIGPLLYERGPKRAWDQIASYLSQLMDRSAIQRTDPAIAAAHLKGLLEAGLVEPLLFGVKSELSHGVALSAAIKAFLAAYAAPAAEPTLGTAN